MICLIALPILAIMALFSATHRRLFLEAIDCVFRKATLRKCQTGLDERLKSKISGRLFDYSPKIGGFVFRRFEILSFIFLMLMIISLFFSAQGIYNYVKYGNCNGENSEGFCIFNFNQNGTSYELIDENCTEGNNYSAYMGDYSRLEVIRE